MTEGNGKVCVPGLGTICPGYRYSDSGHWSQEVLAFVLSGPIHLFVIVLWILVNDDLREMRRDA